MHRLTTVLLATCLPFAALAQDPASEATRAAQAEIAKRLPLDDPRDEANVLRGKLAEIPGGVILDRNGKTVWDRRPYAFLDAKAAPDTVNPSLWRQARLNAVLGLFEVVPGKIWQVRGYDISVMTIIRGKTGWIVVDPLTSKETAAAALALARKHLGSDPISALIITHSHVDHFGGIEAVLPTDEAARSALRIVAPKGFIEEATSENVLAGVAMGRRAGFMYGMSLERSPRGHVDTGLGKGPARGQIGIAVPTDLVDHTPQEMEIPLVAWVA